MTPPRVALVGIVCMLAPVVTAPTAGAAGARYSGTITGSFESPELSGAYLERESHRPVPRDNAATARRSGVGTSTVAWGGDDGGGTAAAGSSLTFSGDAFGDVAAGQGFRLGTITYANGPSGPASLIFGLTLHLSAGEGITPFDGPVAIVSTQNADVDRAADADVLSFSGLETPTTLAAFEDTSVTAILYGKITDDARLSVTALSLAPGQAEHGCLDVAPFDASRGPCPSACGNVCVTLARDLAFSPCGAEQLPAALTRRIERAASELGHGANTRSARRARKAVRVALKELRGAARLAARAARSGHMARACAGAIGAAAANAGSQAGPWLDAR